MVEEYTDFPIEMHVDFEISPELDDELYREAEDTLRELAKGHTDITGASIAMSKPAEGRETSYVYETTVTVYARPKRIASTEKADDPLGSLKGALRATERQVRKERGKRKEDRGSLDDLSMANFEEPEEE